MTITAAAEYVYTGKSYLSRLFEKYTGKYFSDYLLTYRLNEACRLLCETTMTNEQVSASCGFCDLPTFYKNFKKLTGTTPKQYVNMFRNNNIHTNEDYMAKNTTQIDSTERVRRAILGQSVDRTPIYGWVSANISEPISRAYGSVAAFEDKYEFDAAHIFGGPGSFKDNVINELRAKKGELTPDLLLDADIFTNPDITETYGNIRSAIEFYKKRGRFCYVQTPGFFENFNGVFGIENQLAYIAEYQEELGELYRRQAQWTLKFADRCIESGADMVHISDDWGAQNNLMFSPNTWRKLIKPNLKTVIDHVHSRGCLVSLHSDGCVAPLVGELAGLGIDCFHPWQESAHMPYSLWLDNYSDIFAILGGICVQTTLGFGNTERLESEIRRIFALLKGKRWICCTTHFVQEHCSLTELAFAYDLIYKLAREQ
jgi:uroporphyrinogen decarboxylase